MPDNHLLNSVMYLSWITNLQFPNLVGDQRHELTYKLLDLLQSFREFFLLHQPGTPRLLWKQPYVGLPEGALALATLMRKK